MSHLRRHVLMILTCLAVVLVWAGSSAAHRRDGLPLVRPASPHPASQTPAPANEDFPGPLGLKPESYWKRLLALEKAGEFQEAWKTGLALANIFPQSPRRGPALLKLAEMAKSQGKTEEALELFGLAAYLGPDSPEASQARLAASTIELVRDLRGDNPVQALRRFLANLSCLPAGYSPELLQEALRMGWQAVHRKVQATSPPPLSLVEEILALWDMQPQGARPPEAARLLADLLKKEGLCEEARALLEKTADKDKIDQPPVIKASGLEQPWLSRLRPGFAKPSGQFTGSHDPQNSLLRAWRPGWRVSTVPSASSGEAFLTWLLPQNAHAARLDEQIPALDLGLLRAWPSPFPYQPNTGYLPKTNLPRTTQAAQSLEHGPARGDLGPFYQDRLGLSHLEDGQVEAAQAAFQEMAQNNDPFWQHLARVRLADLELSRLQAELAP